MYSVYLVDDEPWALKIIENGFPWQKYGFYIQGKSRTVNQAFEEISQLQPDIVFTDIRIAGENGIDLIRKLKVEGSHSVFIIVTGYDDFNIAQAAIKLDVFDFLLKPVDLEEAEVLLVRLQKHLQAQTTKRSSCFSDMLGNLTISECVHKYGGFENVSASHVVIVNGTATVQNANTPYAPQITLQADANIVLYIFEHLPGFESGVLKSLHSAYPTCDIGVSEVSNPDTPISMPLKHAMIASHQSYITGKQSISIYNGNHYKSVLQLADHLLSQDTQISTDELYRLWLKETYHIEDLAHLVRCIAQAIKVEATVQYMDLLSNHKNAYALADWLLDKLSLKKLSATQGNKEQIYQLLLQLIQERFTQEISLLQLSQEMNLSVSYLSEIFTQYQGVSFSKYIKTLRNTRACELLRSTQLSIQDVAELSGFNDYFYFCKQFKNEFGITPKQYRLQNE